MLKSVEIILVNKEGQVLLGQRKNCAGEGSWGFPGGHIEDGEEASEALKREAKEELNIDPTKITLQKEFIDPKSSGKQYHRHTFLIEEYEGEITNNEPHKCEGWRWFHLDNMPLQIFAGHIFILAWLWSDEVSEKIRNSWRSNKLAESIIT